MQINWKHVYFRIRYLAHNYLDENWYLFYRSLAKKLCEQTKVLYFPHQLFFRLNLETKITDSKSNSKFSEILHASELLPCRSLTTFFVSGVANRIVGVQPGSLSMRSCKGLFLRQRVFRGCAIPLKNYHGRRKSIRKYFTSVERDPKFPVPR